MLYKYCHHTIFLLFKPSDYLYLGARVEQFKGCHGKAVHGDKASLVFAEIVAQRPLFRLVEQVPGLSLQLVPRGADSSIQHQLGANALVEYGSLGARNVNATIQKHELN